MRAEGLKKGKSREVLVVGPDGQPQAHIQASGLSKQVENPMTDLNVDHFTVANLFPANRVRWSPGMCPRSSWAWRWSPTTGSWSRHPDASAPGRRSAGGLSTTRASRARGLEIQLEDGKLPIHTPYFP